VVDRPVTDTPAPGPAAGGANELLLHDLGQPLAAIRALAWSPLPADSAPAATEAVERLRRIHELAELMTELVVSAAPGTGRSPAAPADVTAVVLDVVVAAAPSFDGSLRCCPGDRATVPVDPLDLRRAVGNLVDNAARAAGPTGRVDVGVVRDNDRVRIEVADDGPGFGFVSQQTGCGLAVALDVAAGCGGALEILDGPQGGALVRLELPVDDAG
jgi:signal transduction histidine kinase